MNPHISRFPPLGSLNEKSPLTFANGLILEISAWISRA